MELQRGAIPVTLDRPRTLFFDHAATWLLIQKYGQKNILSALYTLHTEEATGDAPPRSWLELKDMDALVFYVWAGLQRDAKAAGETLTLEDVGDLIVPMNFDAVFNSVVIALGMGTRAPAAGKSQAPAGSAPASVAATAGDASAAPKNPGPTKVTTLSKRNVSRTHR